MRRPSIAALLAAVLLSQGVECQLLGFLNKPLSSLLSSVNNAVKPVVSVVNNLTSGINSANITQAPTRSPDIAPIGEPLTCGLNRRVQSGSGNNISGPGDWPWMVSILNIPTIYYVCAGAIANRRWVVTTALCMKDRTQANQTMVRIGEYNLSSPSPGAVSIGLSQVVLHEGYESGGFMRNDIALLQLAAPVPAAFPAVCFPAPAPTYAGRSATITGWGASESTNRYVSRDAVTSVWDNARCAQSYAQLVNYQVIFNTSLCANYTPCGRDQGSPVVLQETTERQWRLIGLFSWAPFLCQNDAFPAVHTRITAYIDWIGSKIA